MNTTTLNLPYKRFVAQVSTGAPRSKSTWQALMAENLEALKACPWREAEDVPVALADHDFTKASHFSDACDAFKMTGNYDSSAMTEVAYAGMAAYRFTVPASAIIVGSEVAVSSISLPVARDRFLKGGLRVACELTSRATPSTDWDAVRGGESPAASAVLAQSAANLLAGTAGAETVTADLSSVASGNPSAYLWVYISLEDYTDRWEMYSAREQRLYAVEGSGMLVGDASEVTFAGTVTPDAGPAVLLEGGSSPTWLQPLPTVNVGDDAPVLPSDVEPVDTFFTTGVTARTASTAQWVISGSTSAFTFTATITFTGTSSVSASLQYKRAGDSNTYGTSSFTSFSGSGGTTYLGYATPITSGTSPAYALHFYVKLPATYTEGSSGMYTVSAQVKWFESTTLTASATAAQYTSSTQGVRSYTLRDPYSESGMRLYDVSTTWWMLRMVGGVPTMMDQCSAQNDESSRLGLESVVDGSESPWTVSVGGKTFTVAVIGTNVTLTMASPSKSWNFTLSDAEPGDPYFDPSVRLFLPGEDANDAVADYGMASVVGDFSHAVATFEAGDQPSDSEVLGRLARMSRAAAGAMLYLHPESGALADELDVLRPVPRFFRAGTAPIGQTSCQPGLSVWYSRPDAPAVASGIVQRDAPTREGVVSDPAFLQLALLALRAPSAFASRLVIKNVGQTAVHNGFVLRFVAWRCPAEQWDGSNGFAMAAMASMPSVYRSDGPSEVSWAVDCTGALLRFGIRNMTAERIGVSQTVTGEIAANAQIAIPLVAPVGAGDVVLIAPEVLGFADGTGGASVYFGRQADPSQGTPGWARYTHNLGWFPSVTGE